jgi:hypothetical protein
MLPINNEIDLDKSFHKLAADILESEKILKESGQHGYMVAYLNLRVSATSHVYNCTGEVVPIANIPAADPDDLRALNV